MPLGSGKSNLGVEGNVVVLQLGDNLVGFVDVACLVFDNRRLFTQMSTLSLHLFFQLPLTTNTHPHRLYFTKCVPVSYEATKLSTGDKQQLLMLYNQHHSVIDRGTAITS